MIVGFFFPCFTFDLRSIGKVISPSPFSSREDGLVRLHATYPFFFFLSSRFFPPSFQKLVHPGNPSFFPPPFSEVMGVPQSQTIFSFPVFAFPATSNFPLREARFLPFFLTFQFFFGEIAPPLPSERSSVFAPLSHFPLQSARKFVVLSLMRRGLSPSFSSLSVSFQPPFLFPLFFFFIPPN